MKAVTAHVGARVVDSYPYSIGGTLAQAKALKASGVDGMIGYLGSMNRDRLAYVFAAGLSFMPVTKAGEYADGPADELEQLRALGMPAGVSVWLDLEGLAAFKIKSDPAKLAGQIKTWAEAIRAGGYMPCLYVGAPQPFSSEELWRLPVVRYWQGIGRCVDRSGALAEPSKCGWCMHQLWHGDVDTPKGGQWWPSASARDRVFVDVNAVKRDYFGRLPAWAVPA